MIELILYFVSGGAIPLSIWLTYAHFRLPKIRVTPLVGRGGYKYKYKYKYKNAEKV